MRKDKMTKQEKREAAQRLFEALSGVDEAFLEASEAATIENRKTQMISGRKKRPVYKRFETYMAAALLLFVLGVSYLALGNSPVRSKNQVMEDSAAGAAMEAACAEEEKMAEGEAVEDNAAELAKITAEAGAEAADLGSGVQKVEPMRDKVIPERDNGFSSGASDAVKYFESRISQQMNQQYLSELVPTEWPPESKREIQWTEAENGAATGVISVAYTDLEKRFTLRISGCADGVLPESAIRLKEWDQNGLAEILADGGKSFTVAYERDGQYVLFAFEGTGMTSADAEGLWTMFDSIGK